MFVLDRAKALSLGNEALGCLGGFGAQFFGGNHLFIIGRWGRNARTHDTSGHSRYIISKF